MSDEEQDSENFVEEPPLKKARKLVKKNVDTIDEDEILDLNGQHENNDEEEVDGDENEEDDEDDEDNEQYHQQYRFMGRAQGFDVSADDLREAQEIFGEGLEDLDEELNEDAAPIDDGAASRPNFEYFQQVQSFSLAYDEEIRNSDIPERFHYFYEGLKDLEINDDIEAVWIVRKLHDLSKLQRTEISESKSQEFMKIIPAILRMIHNEGLEVPTIWLYRRDYLPLQMTRSELWDIFWQDIKFRTLEKEKQSAISMLQKLEEDVDSLVDDNERSECLDVILHLRQSIQYSSNDETVEFAIADIPLLVQRLGGSGAFKKKSAYGKYSHLSIVRTVVRALVAPAHSVGKALKNNVDISSPTIPPASFHEFVASTISAISHTPTDVEISKLSTMAFTVAAKEISCDPLVRFYAKKFYLEEGTLNTNATEKGLSEISPFSEYFGLHMLRRKPIRELLTSEGLLFFMRLLEAEEKGLITIDFQNPFNDTQHSSYRQSSISSLSDRLRNCIVQLSASDENVDAVAKSSFAEARLFLFEKLMGENLSPLTIKDAKAELTKLGRNLIMMQAAENFEKRLRVGPFVSGFGNVTKNLQIAKILLDCPNRPRCQKIVGMFISPDHGSIDAVCIDKDAALISTCFMPSLMTSDWEEKLKLFLFEHKPDAIILNSSGREKTSRVKGRIESKIIQDVNEVIRVSAMSDMMDDDEVRQPTFYAVEIAIYDDEIPSIFMRSQRAKDMYPDLESKTCAALSLARLAVEPLLEYCSLWKGVDSTSTFGFEAMFLKLHPLQELIKHEKKNFLFLLETKLSQAVSDVGVDLHFAGRHQHYGAMLAFIPGLGLRKAEKLIRDIVRLPDKFFSRFSLHDEKHFLSNNVWTNACGFIKLSQKLGYQRFNPLDNTRIHPICYEVYDFVRRLCADALDVENKPESQMQIIADVKSNIRKSVEKYFLPDKDGMIKWERVLDVVEYGSSIVADGGFSRKYKEIKDDLEALELTEYADELETNNKGKRRLELDLIKDELRYPWLDLRKYNFGFSQEEFRNLMRREILTSSFLGQKVAVKILEVRNSRSPFLIVETDDGVRGFINEDEISDDQKEFKYEELCSMVSVGERRIATITGLRYGDKLVLSLRPSIGAKSEAWWMKNRTDSSQQDTRDWWGFYCSKRGRGTDVSGLFDRSFDEPEALSVFEEAEKSMRSTIKDHTITIVKSQAAAESKSISAFEKIDQSVRFHPFFVNLSATDAEAFLRRKMAENRISIPAVIRPSSKGPTHLAIVWAFRSNQFMHIHVEQVSNPRDPSRPLFIVHHPSSNRPFADIDEIFSEYIGRMHDYAVSMTRHKNFNPGSQVEVEGDMRKQVAENPDRISYYLRYEDERPGMFAITWMDKTYSCRTVKILVTNMGFQAGSRSFSSPNEVVVWLKRSAVTQEPQVAAAPPKRVSRFT